MVQGGARGETLTEINRTLHIEGAEASHHEHARAILAHLNAERDDYELSVTNRLFAERSATLEAPYLALTREQYGAELEPLDFMGAPDASREHINAWVAERTSNRITDLLAAGSVGPLTRLVLVNTVYFLGRWATEFATARTHDSSFTLIDGESVDVPTMHRTGSMLYAQIDGVSVVELPYPGDELSMSLILPEDAEGLRALGMQQAFQPSADFTGISDPENHDERLFIDAVFHQTFIKVEERGTEAAAATAVVVRATGGMGPSAPTRVAFDRPFLFAIRDRASGAILFLGRVADPR